MFKLCGSGLVMCGSLLLGNYFVQSMMKRIHCLLELVQVLDEIEMKACYDGNLLPEIFEEMSKQHDSILGIWLASLARQINEEEKDFDSIWQDTQQQLLQVLTGNDLQQLEQLGKRLMCSNTISLTQNLQYVKNRLQIYIEQLEKDFLNQKKLYYSLSACTGLLLVVVFI